MLVRFLVFSKSQSWIDSGSIILFWFNQGPLIIQEPLEGLSQALYNVPSIGHLYRLGRTLPHDFGIGIGPVAANDLDAGCARSQAVSVCVVRSGSAYTSDWHRRNGGPRR